MNRNSQQSYWHLGGEILSPSNKDDIPKIIAHLNTPGTMKALCDQGLASEVMDFIKGLPQDQQTNILAVDKAAYSLSWKQAEELFSHIKTLPQAAQVHILSAEEAIPGFASNQKAAEVWEYIRTLPDDAQETILSRPDTVNFLVRGLAKTGREVEVVEHIKSLSLESKDKILMARNAVWGLINVGQADETLNIMNTLSPTSREAILTNDHVMSALVWANRGKEALDFIKPLSQAAQRHILSEPGVVEIFIRYGHKKDLKKIMGKWSPKGSLAVTPIESAFKKAARALSRASVGFAIGAVVGFFKGEERATPIYNMLIGGITGATTAIIQGDKRFFSMRTIFSMAGGIIAGNFVANMPVDSNMIGYASMASVLTVSEIYPSPKKPANTQNNDAPKNQYG